MLFERIHWALHLKASSGWRANEDLYGENIAPPGDAQVVCDLGMEQATVWEFCFFKSVVQEIVSGLQCILL